MGVMALPAQAQDTATEIRQLLEQRDAEIKNVIGETGTPSGAERERLKGLITGLIDFRAMSRDVLGDHWQELNSSQRNEFVDVFGDVVRLQSLSNLEPYRARVTYEDITVKNGEAHVTTSTQYRGDRIVVEYDLLRSGGEWRARDIIIDEVSTVSGYQRSFRNVIRQRGFDGLMETLRDRREKAEQEQS